MEQEESLKSEKTHRRICILLWVLVGISLIAVIGCRYEEVWKKFLYPYRDQIIGSRDFFIDGQESLVVSGGLLYYCDVSNYALCSYNLETKEIRILEEKAGVLKKTGTGIYYTADFEVYRVFGGALSFVYRIPADVMNGVKFIDIDKDAAYWIESKLQPETGETGEKEGLPCSFVYFGNITGENEPKLLFQTEGIVRDAVFVHRNIYVMTQNGVYKVEPETGETAKLSDLHGRKFCFDETHIVFQEYSKDEDERNYYEILPDGKIKELAVCTGYVGDKSAAVVQGKLYYIDNDWLRVCDLTAEKIQEEPLFELKLSARWLEMYEQEVILRQHLGCGAGDIWVCDLESGVKECVIEQD